MSTSSILDSINNNVPDIKTDFSLARHMPINNSDQQKIEKHDISSADFEETRGKIGRTNSANRHVECTDCHNPHRVIKSRLFNSVQPADKVEGTHNHDDGSNIHNNLASGALRGSLGVEPVYSSTAFQPDPVQADVEITYQVKKGIPPLNGNTDVTSTYVTREY
ncbi:MAG: hypothetical protein CUN57_01265, partial [Phototrophicales bacterium]